MAPASFSVWKHNSDTTCGNWCFYPSLSLSIDSFHRFIRICYFNLLFKWLKGIFAFFFCKCWFYQGRFRRYRVSSSMWCSDVASLRNMQQESDCLDHKFTFHGFAFVKKSFFLIILWWQRTVFSFRFLSLVY